MRKKTRRKKKRTHMIRSPILLQLYGALVRFTEHLHAAGLAQAGSNQGACGRFLFALSEREQGVFFFPSRFCPLLNA